MSTVPLTAEKLRRICDPAQFNFKTTAELEASSAIVGQTRGVRAIEFGINIKSTGYNIYVLGETGTGRKNAIRRYLQERTRDDKSPDDWVYVHNFAVPHQPRTIEFPSGQGAQFKRQMTELVNCLKEDIGKAFDTEEYQIEVDGLSERMEHKQKLTMREFERKAKEAGFGIARSASGLMIVPVIDGERMTPEQYEKMSPEEQIKLEESQRTLENSLDETMKKSRDMALNTRDELRKLDRKVAQRTAVHHFEALNELYKDHDEVLLYLGEMFEDVLDSVDEFRPQMADLDLPPVPPTRRYDVNLFIDNAKTRGAPVIVESHPTYHHLIGRIEYELRNGAMETHFTNLRPGSLHRANGGYLVMEAADVLTEPYAWDALKRAIKTEEVVLQPIDGIDGNRVLSKSLDPEPIPLDIKIVLMGSAGLYHHLWDREEEFNELFKVKADFGTTMERDQEHEMQYARFVATRCAEENLPPFDQEAVARIVEYGSELCSDQTKLSTRFGEVADLIREASFWAFQHDETDCVKLQHVKHALEERVFRSNKVEKLIDEDIERGSILLSTKGEAVGQINALSVLDMGDYAFGRPNRITARTYMGSSGVVHIERETNMADPIHNKGVMTLAGYMGGQYAGDFPLTFSSSLTFEQNYAGIGGDSASSAELYALLSSISEAPIKQTIAVTGSINQKGDIQPIGGVNEKIEGFFRICEMNGLTGDQGVIIPTANVEDMMLEEDVIAAVSDGKFNIWAIDHVDQGIELLFGMTAGEISEEGDFPDESVHGIVFEILRQMSKKDDNDDQEPDTPSDEKESEEKKPAK